MKTTVEIDDVLFERARSEAKRRGVTMKSLIHQALQALLTPRTATEAFELDLPIVRDERPPAVDVADRRALYDYMEER